jgi:hypothetical protein
MFYLDKKNKLDYSKLDPKSLTFLECSISIRTVQLFQKSQIFKARDDEAEFESEEISSLATKLEKSIKKDFLLQCINLIADNIIHQFMWSH